MKIKKLKYHFLLILFIVSLISSLVLSLSPDSLICDPDKGCDVVKHSEYNYTLGIQNSHYGVFIFTIASILIFLQIKNPTKQKRQIISTIIILGSLVALYFLYVQYAILQSYCNYCLTVDISMILSLVILLFYWKE